MAKTRGMRVGLDFLNLKNSLKKNIEPSIGRKLSDREITNSISNFITSEDLQPIMEKRAKKYNNRRGLF